MIPIRDDNPTRTRPYVTYALIGLNILAFLFETAALRMHGGFMHLASNMLFLWIFGDNVEDAIGRVRYIVFYLLCGLCAAAAQVLTDPGSPAAMIGASGAIAGVLGAYLVLYPRAPV